MCATRYAIMMLRFAATARERRAFNAPIDYPKKKWV
jgi:hypothetical protein